MNFRFTVLETSVNRAEFRWKALRLLQLSSVLGVVVSLLFLALGAAILGGWIVSKPAAVALVSAIVAAGFVAWAVIIIAVMAGTPERRWLAAAVERVDRRLLDRLNTLVFLEGRRGDRRAESFAVRIARQAQILLAQRPFPSPFPSSKPLAWFCIFLLALTAAVSLYQAGSPWRRLVPAQKGLQIAQSDSQKPLELAPPATNNVEQNKSWGEVRITDPGMDLKVTKVDVVPLQIEAAANQPLKAVDWYSAVNGAQETPHELPPPKEPRYAAYQPTVYLDELNLSDWDVLTYYAKASTESTNAYASEVYFLEIRPFREDILKLPGGENGQAYQTLNELSGLISRQEHVIRQTHQHVQNPADSEVVREQDREKLSASESDLGDAAQHLYAKMATGMENRPIGDALDNLAKAQKSLGSASKQLDQNALPQAQNHERSALTELIAARKTFQKAVTDHPEAFEEPQQEDPSPVADSAQKLDQMAEFRNEAKAAREFVRKTLEDQKNLEQQSRTAPLSQYSRMAGEQQRLQKALRDFQAQHPKPFDGSDQAAAQAQQSMGKAADSLQNRRPNARAATQEATRDLETLNNSLQSQSADRQLADAYRLKQMLDRQIRTLDQRSKPDSQVSDPELQKTVRDAKETVDQLKKTAEQEPTRDAFGQPLRDALSGANKVDVDARLMQLQQAQDEASKQQLSAKARDGLDTISKAFDASQPKSLQMARQNDSLKPGDSDSFNQGMAELDSLVKQLEKSRPTSAEDRAKQGRQALADLQTGMRSQYGDNDRGNQLMLRLDQLLKTDTPPDVGDLRKLLEELQHFSVESSAKLARNEDHPDVTNIDPSRLPPAYRGRIQKYFQKLSEK